MADKRATREFTSVGDPWPTVDEWAQNQGYTADEQSADHREFHKGGFWTARRKVGVTKAGDTVRVEAWIAASFPARVMALFIVPAEITVASGGMVAALPRKMGRSEVNTLLEKLGQPPIT
jgi:hypothetical protein